MTLRHPSLGASMSDGYAFESRKVETLKPNLYAYYNNATNSTHLTRWMIELLDLIQEECGEVVQARSKMRRGGENPEFASPKVADKGMSNRQLVAAELYDVKLLIAMAEAAGLISEEEYREHVPTKLMRMKKWTNLFDDAPIDMDAL